MKVGSSKSNTNPSSCLGNLIGTDVANTSTNGATNTFSIYKNYIFTCNSHGVGSYTFNSQDLPIPAGTITGSPATLQDLYQMVGPNNISIDYYVSALGSVSSHECWAVYTLYATAVISDPSCTSYTNKVSLASTSDDPSSGAPVNSGWIPLIKNTVALIVSLQTHEESVGSGTGCKFESEGGWKTVSISLKIDVAVNLYNYCTLNGTKNIHTDMCYNYISDYIGIKGLGADQHITDYMKSYCITAYPKGGLSIFNEPLTIDQRDYNICGCNMPDQYYQQFEQSIKSQYPNLDLGSIRPNCLLPACVTSTFKNNELSGCPVPQCLDIVNINNSNIADNVNVSQKQKCNQIFNGGTPTPGPSPSPSPGPTPSPSTKSFWEKYKWWILGIILVIIILTIVIMFVTTRSSDTDFQSGGSSMRRSNKFSLDKINSYFDNKMTK